METNNIILNWKRQPEDNRDFKSTRHLTAPVELPSQFELDAQIPIYDQQDLGSCTANSGCACYRYEYKQLKGDFKFDPSRLYLYYNTREIEGWENEDSGAYIRDVFKALNKKGLCEEQYFPYVSADFAKKPTTVALENGQKYQTVKYAVVEQSEQAIKQTLLSGAAVSFGFDVYSSFMYGSWKEVSPIPTAGEQLLGGHAVTIIGYSDAKQAFLIQNSWGTDWKLNGKFWMPYSFVTNPSYADDFWCIETINVVSDNPTPQPENIKERVKSIFTESVILDASKSTIQHLASLVGCNLSGVFRSKIAKQLRDFLYK